MADTGMLRIRYKGRETVFEYRGIKKEHIREKLIQHLVLWRYEGNPKVEIPLSTVSAEWIENEGQPNETAEKVEIPKPATQ